VESPKAEIRKKMEKAKLLEEKLLLQRGLPHLYGYKWYSWAREFFESRNKDNFLCAANQVSKSSTQIRKVIDWATNQELWGKLWPHSRPRQFWYLYPTKDVCSIEFEKKWIPEFLPRDTFKEHPRYGWRVEMRNKHVFALHFNSGVSVYFKTYGQDAQDLQTGTVDAIFCDEELEEHLYPELNMRRAATDGYFHMVFTATLGQELWRETMEERGTKLERFKEAYKRQVSMFECLKYEDGTPSHWTEARIQKIINSCATEAEVQRRVFGRFVVSGGRRFPSFERKEHVKMPQEPGPPPGWLIYSGSDVGGGGTGHPSAHVFVAVRPDYQFARVFRAWRGDGLDTSNGDTLAKYQEMRAGLPVVQARYDYHAKDFYIIATRAGETFLAAEKSHDIGVPMVNVLFKNGMLVIDAGDEELNKLVIELSNVKIDTPKNKAKDDLADALRYCIASIPWDWSAISDKRLIPLPRKSRYTDEERGRRGVTEDEEFEENERMLFDVENELDAVQELYDVD
jgi:hypothetical protein